jgi:hypothetical protein
MNQIEITKNSNPQIFKVRFESVQSKEVLSPLLNLFDSQLYAWVSCDQNPSPFETPFFCVESIGGSIPEAIADLTKIWTDMGCTVTVKPSCHKLN